MKLFQAIFGGNETAGGYPETLIDAAIERAVDGTDPRLRLLPGYRKQLRGPVIAAIDHVVPLVEQVPGPLPAGRATYGSEPLLSALFASPDSMLEAFGRAPDLIEFLQTTRGGGADEVFGLLVAERRERNVLGMDLVGDQVRREVAQVSVSFDGHRLVEPEASLAETRRQLRHRAFDHLLMLALGRIARLRGEREDLLRERDLLRRRQSALQRGGCGLEDDDGSGPTDLATLTTELAGINAQLAALGSDATVLKADLAVVADTLNDAAHQLWFEEVRLALDAMNIVRAADDPSARGLLLHELHSGAGLRRVLLLVRLNPTELPAREDFLAMAARYQY